MRYYPSLSSVALLASLVNLLAIAAAAQAPTLVCQPTVTSPIIVASPAQRLAAGNRAEPPVTDF